MTSLIAWLLALAISATLAAFALRLVWRWYKLKESLKPKPHFRDLVSYPSKFVHVGEFDVHYIQEGKGPHLLLIHGIGASTYAWRMIFPELVKKFTVTAIDLPGFGQSSKHTHLSYDLDSQALRIKHFLGQLGIHQCRVVGSSMGGTLALWLNRLDPEMFFEVALIGPAVRPNLIPMDIKRLAWTSKLLKWGVNEALVKSIMHRVVENKELITTESIKAYLKPYTESSAAIKTFIKSTETVQDNRLPHEFAKVQGRVLVLWGERDRITPVKDLTTLKGVLPNIESYIHPSGGHHLMEDDPEWVVKSLESFFGNAHF